MQKYIHPSPCMMNVALIFLSFTPVLIAKTTQVLYHQYDRITTQDNLQTSENPSCFRQARSFLECGLVCSQDELCVAIVLYGGQCYIYSSSVSSSGVAKHGVRAYRKRGAKSCPADFLPGKERNICLKVVANPTGTFNAKRCSELFTDARPAQIETPQKHQAVVNYLKQKGTKSNVYVGGKQNSKGGYLWLDGNDVKESLWCPDEPRQKRACLQLWKEKGFCLDDTFCNYKRPILCEVPLN